MRRYYLSLQRRSTFTLLELRVLRGILFLGCILSCSLCKCVENCDASTSNEAKKTSVVGIWDSIAILSNIATLTYEAAYELGFGDVCPYAKEPVAAVKESLEKNIKGQSIAIEEIVSAFASWQFKRNAGHYEPLVLALTGQTGIGKTETAWTIARALLTKHDSTAPKGLIVLSGTDFMDSSKIDEYHNLIRNRIGEVILSCDGNAVIIFDELQKVASGTLDVLLPALQEHSYLMLKQQGKIKMVNCRNMVVLLVSDIGAELLRNGILPYKKRENVPKNIIMSAVRRALDQQWKNLNFGKVVNWVIPYLPMRRSDVYEVLRDKINLLEQQLISNNIAAGLNVTNDLIWELTGKEFMPYGQFQYIYPDDAKLQEESFRTVNHTFSVFGGRVDRGGGPLEYLRKIVMEIENSAEIHTNMLNASLSTVNGEKVTMLYSCPNNYAAGAPNFSPNSYQALQECTFLVSAPLQKLHASSTFR